MFHLLIGVAQANNAIVPVVQGGMQWVGYAELASAVSNAGGLGIVRTFPTLQIVPYAHNLHSSQHSPNPPQEISVKRSAAAVP